MKFYFACVVIEFWSFSNNLNSFAESYLSLSESIILVYYFILVFHTFYKNMLS